MAKTLGEVFRFKESPVQSVIFNGQPVRAIAFNGRLIYPEPVGSAESGDYGGAICALTVSGGTESWREATESGSFYKLRYEGSENIPWWWQGQEIYLRFFVNESTGQIIAETEDYLNYEFSLYSVERQNEGGEWEQMNIVDFKDKSVNGNYRLVLRSRGGM